MLQKPVDCVQRIDEGERTYTGMSLRGIYLDLFAELIAVASTIVDSINQSPPAGAGGTTAW